MKFNLSSVSFLLLGTALAAPTPEIDSTKKVLTARTHHARGDEIAFIARRQEASTLDTVHPVVLPRAVFAKPSSHSRNLRGPPAGSGDTVRIDGVSGTVHPNHLG